MFEELFGRPTEEKFYKNKKDAAYQNENEFIGAKFSEEFNRSVEKAVKRLIWNEE